MSAARWAIAGLIGSAMTTVGCARPTAEIRESVRTPIVADDSLMYAIDTSLEMRLIDRLEPDNYLRDRDIRIHVVEGVVNISGEVWTMVEKERVGEIIRDAAGMIDVVNDLDIRAPR